MRKQPVRILRQASPQIRAPEARQGRLRGRCSERGRLTRAGGQFRHARRLGWILRRERMGLLVNMFRIPKNYFR